MEQELSQRQIEQLRTLIQSELEDILPNLLNQYAAGITHALGIEFDGTNLFHRFDPSYIEFNPKNAIQLARASGLAYKDQKAIHWELNRGGFEDDNVLWKEQGTTQVFAVSSHNCIYVAFRGTRSFRDWLVNIQVGKSRLFIDREDRVHGGFVRALDDVWTELYEFLDLQDPNRTKSIWLTGHSLGGALATLTAARLLHFREGIDNANGHRVEGLYTFGQPKVGNSTFSHFLDSKLKNRYFRLINSSDPVPLLPLRLQGYRSAGQLQYFDAQGQMHAHRRPDQIFADYVQFYIIYVLEFFAVRIIRSVFAIQFTRSLLEYHSCRQYEVLLRDYINGLYPKKVGFLRVASYILLAIIVVLLIVPLLRVFWGAFWNLIHVF